jgi:hypothetical protein
VHVIAQSVCTLSDYELIFGTSGVIECVIGFEQGAAWHASVELAIWIAGRRWKDTVGTGLIVSEWQGEATMHIMNGGLCDSRARTDNGACRYWAWAWAWTRDWHNGRLTT